MIRLGLILLLCAASAAAWADDGLAQIRARIEPASVLRGDFVQEKSLPGFQHPLRSRGRFLLAREHGVIWDTQAPFASELVIGARGLSIDGQREVGAEVPALARIHRLLIAAIAGDIDALAAEFEITAEPSDSSWTLRLRPRDAATASVLSAIELQGQSTVDRVRLSDADGVVTNIQFSAQSREPAVLSADEAARFD